MKGGKLAQLAYPAKVVGLILSDIIGDPIDLVRKKVSFTFCLHVQALTNGKVTPNNALHSWV